MPITTPISVRCDRLGDRLPALLDDPDALSGADRRHLEQCLRCQADLARSRRIQRILRSMRAEMGEADPGRCDDALGGVLDGLDSAAERRDRQRVVGLRAASIVGLAAATAAGVGGVLVLATRRRSA